MRTRGLGLGILAAAALPLTLLLGECIVFGQLGGADPSIPIAAWAVGVGGFALEALLVTTYLRERRVGEPGLRLPLMVLALALALVMLAALLPTLPGGPGAFTYHRG